MRFLHLADLHFGKSIHGVSLLENGDQKTWAARFLALVRETRPDAVVIAGDIYDRSAPSGDAVALLDTVVTALAEMGTAVLLVAGNHDSGQRLAFGGSLLAKQNIHISGVLSPELTCVTLMDKYGPVHFWLMPYVFPALVAQALEDDAIRDYDAAVRALLARQRINFSERNVLVAHQNVTAGGKEAERGGSESMVGGVGQVDHTAFDGFEYVALGHIHAAYPVGRQTVRYAGSPLCYHFDETKQPKKGPVLVTLGEKGTEPTIEIKGIAPLHPMREIKGTYEEIRDAALQSAAHGEYIRIVLTDRKPEPETRTFFQNLFESRDSVLMEFTSEYSRFGAISAASTARAAEGRSVEELFMDFYENRYGGTLPDKTEQELLRFAGEQVRKEEEAALDQQSKALLDFALEQEDAE